jgi:hypothetical protein
MVAAGGRVAESAGSGARSRLPLGRPLTRARPGCSLPGRGTPLPRAGLPGPWLPRAVLAGSVLAWTSSRIPGTSTGIPGTSTGMPGTTAGIPGTSAGIPGTSAGMPGTSAGMPGTAGIIPRTGGLPGTGGVPRTAAGLPGTGRPGTHRPRPRPAGRGLSISRAWFTLRSRSVRLARTVLSRSRPV